MSIPTKRGAMRILDTDCEARPGAVWYEGKPTWQLTAIAAAWVDSPGDMKLWLLGRDTLEDMLIGFRALWDEADMITGHNYLAYDAPLVNGSMVKAGMAPLSPKLIEDTKAQYVKRGPMPASQEYLGAMMGLALPKVHMSIWQWEKSNRLLSLYPEEMAEGLEQTAKRVTSDVQMHMKLRTAMHAQGLMKQPRVWRP